MSVSAQTWVWDHSETNGNDRLVLLWLADQGDDDGTNSFPSFRTIAAKCTINLATVGRVIDRLESIGEILVDRPERRGRGHFNRYTLVLGRPIEDVELLQEKGRDLRPFSVSAKRSVKEPKRTTTRAPDARIPTDPLTQDSALHLATDETLAKERARGESEIRFDEHFWPAYPDRDGKKLDKAKALAEWVRLAIDDQRAAAKGVRYYAASGQRAKDAYRWLRDRCWEDWQTPAAPSNGYRQSGFADVMNEIREELSQ